MNYSKKIAFIAAAVAAFGLAASADDSWSTSAGSCYQKGDKSVNVGLMFPYIGLYGAFDYGFHDAISGGVTVGYYNYSVGVLDYNDSYTYIPVAVRGLLHIQNLTVLKQYLPIRDKLDIYVGLAIGYDIGFYTWPDPITGQTETVGASDFVLRENVGIRYYFTPKIAAFIEDAGFEEGLGVTFKF